MGRSYCIIAKTGIITMMSINSFTSSVTGIPMSYLIILSVKKVLEKKEVRTLLMTKA